MSSTPTLSSWLLSLGIVAQSLSLLLSWSLEVQGRPWPSARSSCIAMSTPISKLHHWERRSPQQITWPGEEEQKYHRDWAKHEIFLPCAYDMTAGAHSKKRATLKHHPGHLWCLNVTLHFDSIVGLEILPWCHPFLEMIDRRWLGAKSRDQQGLFWPWNKCAVLPSHQPNFWFLGECVPARVFLEKNWWELFYGD